MALTKFILQPEQSGYSASPGKETLSVKLDGGASKTRLDILNSSSMVNVQFILDANEYKYANAFYKTQTKSGSLPFLIDLILDSNEIVEYEAKFVENSFKLTSQQGLRYDVSAQLEVVPIPADEEFDLVYIELVNLYGGTEQLSRAFNNLNILANITMPDYLQ